MGSAFSTSTTKNEDVEICNKNKYALVEKMLEDYTRSKPMNHFVVMKFIQINFRVPMKRSENDLIAFIKMNLYRLERENKFTAVVLCQLGILNNHVAVSLYVAQ